jgi:histidinol dehydrogenase
MKVIRFTERDFADQCRRLATESNLFDPIIEQRTRAILDDVRARGDAALLELTERFDGARLTADQIPVSKVELVKASLQAGDALRRAVTAASRNIKRFSRKSLRRDWSTQNAQGATVGEKFDPFQRVGLYIPGGTAPLMSTALMTITLARVAGCPEIVVCTPCHRDGQVNPGLLFAARSAGATEIYKAGGAQAIAALAYGTDTIRRVDKIFGPGNRYVVTAKRLLFGQVAVDLLPGPSEVLVLADDTANARFAAADLLAQAEHEPETRVWLVTTSRRLLASVEKEMERQLPALSRRDIIQQALDNHGCLALVKTLDQGIDLVNQLAPEHCEVMTRNPAKVAQRIRTAGAIFLGPWSPTVTGDYVAGPSHTLPVGGTGRSFAGLTVDQFQRRTSVVQYTKPALAKSLSGLQTFASVEGLDAHGRSAAIRVQSSKSKAQSAAPPRRIARGK